MTHAALADDPRAAAREKTRVAALSLVAAVGMTGAKLGIGLWTNSLGILSEAAHSGLDLLATLLTLWAVRQSGRPADPEHTYGHGKFENLSALLQTALLLITCAWIGHEALARLFWRAEVVVEANAWAFAVVIGSIAVDYSRARALRRAARRHQSQALEADALHFSTDIWSSLVVLVGLVGVFAAERYAAPGLIHADALAALVVSILVAWISLRLGRRAIDELLDRVPSQLQRRIVEAAAATAGVERVGQVRLRRSGPAVFVDVALGVGRDMPFERAHQIADAAEEAVRTVVPGADVVVHVEPVVAAQEELSATARVIAAREGLDIHGLRILDQQGRRTLELHAEADASLNVGQAHQRVSAFEQSLREAVPELDDIITHIEPAGGADASPAAQSARDEAIRAVIARFAAAQPLPIRPHDVEVRRVGGECSVSLHCALEADTPLVAAHELSSRLEQYLRRNVPGLGRVVVHVEPSGRAAAADEPPGDA